MVENHKGISLLMSLSVTVYQVGIQLTKGRCLISAGG